MQNAKTRVKEIKHLKHTFLEILCHQKTKQEISPDLKNAILHLLNTIQQIENEDQELTEKQTRQQQIANLKSHSQLKENRNILFCESFFSDQNVNAINHMLTLINNIPPASTTQQQRISTMITNLRNHPLLKNNKNKTPSQY